MERVRWVLITEDNTCILKQINDSEYILTLPEERFDENGNHYSTVFLQNKDFSHIEEQDIKLSEKVKELYGESDIPKLKITKAITKYEESSTEEAKNKLRNRLKTVSTSSNKKQSVVLDDTLYVILTEDKKCILRGRRNTRFILSTLEEHSNSRVFTCRQFSSLVGNINNKNGTYHVYLTDEVKKLYSINGNLYDTETMPKLVAFKAQTQYKVEL